MADRQSEWQTEDENKGRKLEEMHEQLDKLENIIRSFEGMSEDMTSIWKSPASAAFLEKCHSLRESMASTFLKMRMMHDDIEAAQPGIRTGKKE